MSKAVTKGTHWLPRASQYSLHGQRNGRVDVLPPNAKMATFEDLEERRDHYRKEYQEAVAAYKAAKDDLAADSEYKRHMAFFHANKDKQYIAIPSKFAKKLDRLKALKDRMAGLAAKNESMRQVFNLEQNVRFERMWIETARAMLPWDVVGKIEGVVAENLKSAQGKKEDGRTT